MSMKKYIAIAAMAAMISENMAYMDAPSGGKTAKSCTKQQKRRIKKKKMDNKFYVSYEAARLLKDKGYNEDVSRYYDEDGFLHFLEYDENYNYFQISNNDLDLDHYAAPTKAEAIDWLESKGIVVELNYDDQSHMDKARWEYFIYTHDKDGWVKAMVCSWTKNNYYKTRLEAEDAAIIKACELL